MSTVAVHPRRSFRSYLPSRKFRYFFDIFFSKSILWRGHGEDSTLFFPRPHSPVPGPRSRSRPQTRPPPPLKLLHVDAFLHYLPTRIKLTNASLPLKPTPPRRLRIYLFLFFSQTRLTLFFSPHYAKTVSPRHIRYAHTVGGCAGARGTRSDSPSPSSSIL